MHDLLGLGLKADTIGAGQVAVRAAVLYVSTLAIVRLGKKRFMGRGTAFDVIVGIVVGSMAGRAITANAPVGTSLAGIAAIVALHWLFSALAVRWEGFGTLVKGRSVVLARDGALDPAALRREHLTRRDLDEDLRQKGRRDLSGIAEARIERDGEVSLCTGDKPPPRVVEVAVEDGVQTVRVVLG